MNSPKINFKCVISVTSMVIISALLLSLLLMTSCSSQNDAEDFINTRKKIETENSLKNDKNFVDSRLNMSDKEMMSREMFINITHHNKSNEFNQDFRNLCNDKNQGDSCSLETFEGAINGTCKNMNDHLICIPLMSESKNT